MPMKNKHCKIPMSICSHALLDGLALGGTLFRKRLILRAKWVWITFSIKASLSLPYSHMNLSHAENTFTLIQQNSADLSVYTCLDSKVWGTVWIALPISLLTCGKS